MSKKSDRIASTIKRLVANILLNEIHDSRLRGVTITGVEVNSDNSHAYIYYTTISDRELVDRALQGCVKRLRRRIAALLSTYSVPVLHFKYDYSLERGNRVDELISKIVSGDS